MGRRVRRTLLELLPADTLIVEEPPAPTRTRWSRAWREAEHHLEVARRLGEDVPSRERYPRGPGRLARAARCASLGCCSGTSGSDLQFGFFPPEKVDRDLNRLRALLGWIATNPHPLRQRRPARAAGRAARRGQPGRRAGALASARWTAGSSCRPSGSSPTTRSSAASAGSAARAATARPRRRAATGALKPGDYVVHLEHGVGIYRGIETIFVGRVHARGRRRRVRGRRPAQRAALPPRPARALSRRRRRTATRRRRGCTSSAASAGRSSASARAQAIQADGGRAARPLRAPQGRRAASPSRPTPAGSGELESSFLFEDTPDQRKATDDVKRRHGAAAADGPPARRRRRLRQDRDRGARGVQGGAVRASRSRCSCRRRFSPSSTGAPSASGSPTSRCKIEVLSPLPDREGAEGGARAARRGARSTSSSARTACSVQDVTFKDLGLIVVDEEHRFGVKHKERLKQLRLAMDVLTLTATPIPRTLHLSLAGLRDLTLMQTPPRDRSPVLTFVEPWDDAPDRGGVRARARSRRAGVLRAQPHRDDRGHRRPRARARAARARRRRPRADARATSSRTSCAASSNGRGGRPRLHDDRRVGPRRAEREHDVRARRRPASAWRSSTSCAAGSGGRTGAPTATCSCPTPSTRTRSSGCRCWSTTPSSARATGSRSRTWSCAAPGNLLGAEQSGYVHAVGFDLYLRWLEETVQALRGPGRRGAAPAPPDVVLDRPAHLPDSFRARRRRASSTSTGDWRGRRRQAKLMGCAQELRERFGPLPARPRRCWTWPGSGFWARRSGSSTSWCGATRRGSPSGQGTAPRLAGLTSALDDVQLAAEVRRTVPLSLRLVRLGGEAIVPALVRALRKAVPTDPDGLDPYWRLMRRFCLRAGAISALAAVRSPLLATSATSSRPTRTWRPRPAGSELPSERLARDPGSGPEGRAADHPRDRRFRRERLGGLRAVRRRPSPRASCRPIRPASRRRCGPRSRSCKGTHWHDTLMARRVGAGAQRGRQPLQRQRRPRLAAHPVRGSPAECPSGAAAASARKAEGTLAGRQGRRQLRQRRDPALRGSGQQGGQRLPAA